jgi:hypothetical protein
MTIYVQLTREFNKAGLRAILAGGQAVVLHNLAIMSKDGDWILREEEETCRHVLSVLAAYGARYRFGAPLDVRWLAGGWSAHLEFIIDGMRIRTDFVTRPPRLDAKALAALWRSQTEQAIPRAGPRELAEMKKTNREKDYAVIGELARLMNKPEDQILTSRSARDLMEMANEHPVLFHTLIPQRPALGATAKGLEELEVALDAERRQLMRTNEQRLEAYMCAAERWAGVWPETSQAMEGLALPDAHEVMINRAETVLPFMLEVAP